MATTGALSARVGDSPIWTGDELLFWGGSSCGASETRREVYGDGAAYNPTTDSWRSLSNKNAPSPRVGHAAVWTGTEMLVWSGDGSGAPNVDDYELLNDSYAYDPANDTWRKLSSEGAPKGNRFVMHAWTGTELLLWGGLPNETMAAYNPKTDRWRDINPNGPHLTYASCDVWTGKYWVMCGNADDPDGGALYDPENDLWRPIPADPAGGLISMSGYAYDGDVIAMGSQGVSSLHGSDLELYRFETPK